MAGSAEMESAVVGIGVKRSHDMPLRQDKIETKDVLCK